MQPAEFELEGKEDQFPLSLLASFLGTGCGEVWVGDSQGWGGGDLMLELCHRRWLHPRGGADPYGLGGTSLETGLDSI